MFTLQTGVPAFQRDGGLPAVRRRERHDEDISKRDGRLDCDSRAGRLRTSRPAIARPAGPGRPGPAEDADRTERRPASEVLDWNQIFIDTLIATNTANSSSQRLGAIVHTAIFDAYNGIERRYTPIFVHDRAPSRRVAPSGGHRCGVHGAGRPVPVPTAGAGCQLCGFARGAERRLRDGGHRRTTLVRDAHRARHRLGNRGRAGRARLARDRWVQRELPSVHRRDRGRPVAADTAGVRSR